MKFVAVECKRRGTGVLGSVETDHCLEVDDAAALELGDLDERRSGRAGQFADGQTDPAGPEPARVMVNGRHSSGAYQSKATCPA